MLLSVLLVPKTCIFKNIVDHTCRRSPDFGNCAYRGGALCFSNFFSGGIGALKGERRGSVCVWECLDSLGLFVVERGTPSTYMF
jgi:hypothetical protein